MTMQETILGFQVRTSPESLPLWPTERRKQFLLRENIQLPLGVDRSVWPPIEGGDPLPSLFDDYIGADVPCNSLHVFTSTSIERIEACSKGAIVILTAAPEEARGLKKWGAVQETSLSLPTLREHGFTRLGFDVADDCACWSVLNDTDPGDARPKLVAEFAGLIDDEHGLFAEWESADQYRKAWKATKKWKESLWVYGIWARLRVVGTK